MMASLMLLKLWKKKMNILAHYMTKTLGTFSL